jgi:LacI family transcriptional regulator
MPVPRQKRTSSVRRKRRHVAVLIENPMASGRQVLDGVAKYADQRGGWSFYFQMGHFSNTLPEWLKYWRGDGILARIQRRRTAMALQELNIPVVDLVGDVPDLGIPSVGIDHQEVAQLAADHLMEQGFCSFGFCGIRGAWWPRWRYNFFRKALATFGYNLHVYWLPMHTAVAWSTEAERIRLTRWITKLPKPIGILGCNDLAAQKVLEACRQAGVLTPEEVAVLGVDNDEEYICRFSDPTLSSIDAGHERVGFIGAEMLDQRMDGKTVSVKPVLVQARGVVVRQSTDVQTIVDSDVTAAVRFIRENACGDMSVQDVAAHVALSYSTLNRRFRRILSHTIHDEILHVRIHRAQALLTQTQWSFARIAEATGFKHQEYLGAVFKAETNMTPAQYRKKMSPRSS